MRKKASIFTIPWRWSTHILWQSPENLLMAVKGRFPFGRRLFCVRKLVCTDRFASAQRSVRGREGLQQAETAGKGKWSGCVGFIFSLSLSLSLSLPDGMGGSLYLEIFFSRRRMALCLNRTFFAALTCFWQGNRPFGYTKSSSTSIYFQKYFCNQKIFWYNQIFFCLLTAYVGYSFIIY